MKYNLNECHTEWLDAAYEKLKKKMAAECTRVGTNIPFYPRDGKYVDLMMPRGVNWWTNGFWPGMLWQMYNATQDDAYKQIAEGVECRLASALEEFDGLHHAMDKKFVNWNPEEDAILGGGTTQYHGDRLANLPIIYNDYYFLEAILRLKDKYLLVW